MGEGAALQEGVELVLDELREVGTGGSFGLGDEGRSVLLYEAVQRGLRWAVALVVNRGAIRRPLGLPADGLHAMLMPKLWHAETVVLHGLKPSGAPPWPLMAPTSGRPPQGVNVVLGAPQQLQAANSGA